MEKGFTLVIPLYNKANCIRTTLDSVLNRHGNYPFKCIIVDDDSTDGSSEIGEEYDTKYPDIFTYVKIKHHGKKSPSNARNFGIKLAETEYIGFLDADDELCAGFIDRGCGFMDEHPEYNMYSNGHIVRDINEKGEYVYTSIYCQEGVYNDFKQMFFSHFCDVHFCAGIYKTELVKQILFGTDVCFEDSVFKLEYAYKCLPLYVDNSTSETIIHNNYTSQCSEWNTLTDNNHGWLLNMMLDFKRKAKCGEYDFWEDENGTVMFQEI